MVNLEGVVLGRCTPIQRILRAQADDVYQVRQITGSAELIVRIAHAVLTPTDPLASHDAATTFTTRATAIARLEHPHIVPLYDAGERAYGDGNCLRFLIMPDMPDGSLADVLASGTGLVLPLRPSTAAAIGDQAASALQFAHDAGILHTTLNLHTVLLRQPFLAAQAGGVAEPQIALADYGLSRFLPGSSLANPPVPVLDCLAPEQREGVALPASDQYALACVLYLLLVGHPAGTNGLVGASVTPSRLNPALPPAMDAVLATALAVDPQARYPSVVDFTTALRAALGSAVSAQRTPAVVSAPNALPPRATRAVSAPQRLSAPHNDTHPSTPERVSSLSRRQVLVGMAQVAGVASLGAAGASALALEHKYASASVSSPIAASAIPQVPVFSQGDSVGFYRPSASTFFLLSSPNTPGVVLEVVLGGASDLPVAGDWTGNGIATVGIFRPGQGVFFLASDNQTNGPLAYKVAYGAPGDLPVIGDWTGIGHASIGVFRPALGLFLLSNSIKEGAEPDFVIHYGKQGDVPLAGDWNGDGKAEIGVYRPSEGKFYLTDMLCAHCSEPTAYQVNLEYVRGIPFVGDWQGTGRDGLGLFQVTEGIVNLKNDATTSGAPNTRFQYLFVQDLPIAGHWGAFAAS